MASENHPNYDTVLAFVRTIMARESIAYAPADGAAVIIDPEKHPRTYAEAATDRIIELVRDDNGGWSGFVKSLMGR